jgi:hypothetical protein
MTVGQLPGIFLSSRFETVFLEFSSIESSNATRVNLLLKSRNSDSCFRTMENSHHKERVREGRVGEGAGVVWRGGWPMYPKREQAKGGLNQSNFNHGSHSVIRKSPFMLKQKQLKNERKRSRRETVSYGRQRKQKRFIPQNMA